MTITTEIKNKIANSILCSILFQSKKRKMPKRANYIASNMDKSIS